MALPDGSHGTGDGAAFLESVLAKLKPIEAFAKWFYSFLVVIIFLAGVAIAIRGEAASFSQLLVLTWSMSLAVGIAATMVGALLGFLFGIPRSLQQRPASPSTNGDASPTPDDKSKLAGIQAFRSNTSLEEISDWLTKIIIGIGLVQFQAFITYLYKAALLAAAFVARKDFNVGTEEYLNYNSDFSSPFFFALILICLIAGCLFVYLETRTRLTLLFVSAEKATAEPDEKKLADSAKRPVTDPPTDGDGRRGPPVTPAPATQDDKDIVKLSREKLSDPKDIVGWALAQARVKNYDVAEDALRDALQKDPGNDDIRLRIADVRRLRGNFAGSNQMINEVIGRTGNRDEKLRLLKRNLQAALYIPSPDGFEQAIRFSDVLFGELSETGDARVHFWRAAAFGQKFEWLGRNAGTDADKELARSEALTAVRKAIELSPGYDTPIRTLLREIFDPVAEKSDPDENDLEVFKNDQKFRDLIYKDKPPT